ncbi:MAG: DUF2846 domain-containing protein [Gammaproteobacteria bacterium]|nr:DUF2846 domain-containing protein [Gammaproteobacteria bacterium]
MKAISKIVLVLMATIYLGGCATGPKFAEISPSLGAVAPDIGRIYVYRTAVLGAALQPEVKLNGEVVGKAVPNGFFYVDQEPGNYKIATSTEVDRHLSLALEKGQTRYVRLNISMGFFVGHVYPELVENEDGEKEIQQCSYTGQK